MQMSSIGQNQHPLAPSPPAPPDTTAESMALKFLYLTWTTDKRFTPGSGIYGPDGPWQALAGNVGNSAGNGSLAGSGVNISGQYTALWPSGGGLSMILTAEAGGNYTAANSTTANITQTMMSNSDGWMASTAVNDTSTGFAVFDTMQLMDQENMEEVNSTLVAVDSWEYGLPDGTNHSSTVGILGLGPPPSSLGSGSSSNFTPPPSILQTFKANGQTLSNMFGLHMGSVALDIPGSLSLGGYETNRVYGPVGIFPFPPNGDNLPMVTLIDAHLGTHVGDSPFPKLSQRSKSIWSDPGESNENAQQISSSLGAPPGSAIVIPNPAAPYIYLPPSICQAAADLLPVIWNARLGLYLWDTSDPSYPRIVSSSACLTFTFLPSKTTLLEFDHASPPSTNNLTIKIPFPLLNLTLISPLVDTPTPYFPCKPLDSEYGFWTLGRAFLQGAFLGIDYERNLTYLAQAPGPRLKLSYELGNTPSSSSELPGEGETPLLGIREVGDGTDKKDGMDVVVPQLTSEWEGTWEEAWTVLGDGDGDGADLSAGVIAGIVVSCVVGAVLVAGLAWWLVKRSKGRMQRGKNSVVRQEGAGAVACSRE